MASEARGWIAVDLDGTLLSRVASEGARVATWRVVDGQRQPSSWMPAPQHVFVSHLAEAFSVVPVTARDLTSFERVRIEDLVFTSGAVVANGAIILRPGDMVPDEQWSREMHGELAEWKGPLVKMASLIEERCNGQARTRLVDSNTPFPAYLVGKAGHGFWSSTLGLDVQAALSPFGCRVAAQGRELQVLPPPVSKRRGTQAFSEMYHGGQAPLLAMGDVEEDLNFMREAVFIAAPTDSSLGRKWRADE